jgi:hypothetical protein
MPMMDAAVKKCALLELARGIRPVGKRSTFNQKILRVQELERLPISDRRHTAVGHGLGKRDATLIRNIAKPACPLSFRLRLRPSGRYRQIRLAWCARWRCKTGISGHFRFTPDSRHLDERWISSIWPMAFGAFIVTPKNRPRLSR